MGLTGYLLPFDSAPTGATIVANNITGTGPSSARISPTSCAPARDRRHHPVALLRDPHLLVPG